MNRKRIGTGLGAAFGMLVLILDGKTALEGAREGVELCIRTVIPSLFPFFVLSMVLTGTLLGGTSPILRPLGRLFRMPKGSESLLIPAFLGGYPAGAQSVASACQNGQLSKAEAERMLAFCSNAGPSFIFGMVSTMFPRKWMVWALWSIHIGGAVFASLLIPGPGNSSAAIPSAMPPSLSGTLTDSLRVMGTVCGWVTLFRVLLAFLNRWVMWFLPPAAQVAVTGLLELTNGCCSLAAISDISARFSVCAGILAFGGLCVTMQTISVTQGLSLKSYFAGKALQALFSLAAAGALFYRAWLPLGLLFLLFLAAKLRKNSSIPSPTGV